MGLRTARAAQGVGIGPTGRGRGDAIGTTINHDRPTALFVRQSEGRRTITRAEGGPNPRKEPWIICPQDGLPILPEEPGWQAGRIPFDRGTHHRFRPVQRVENPVARAETLKLDNFVWHRPVVIAPWTN